MDNEKTTSDLIRGNIDTMILRLLIDKNCYGYEIIKLIYKRSNKQYELKEATMYSSVRRLEINQDIQSYWGTHSQGGRRKYFRITKKGRITYIENKKKWEFAKTIIDKLI